MDERAAPQPGSVTLGAYTRQTRERAGLPLRNLEVITSISRPMVNRLEWDRIEIPSPDVLHRPAEALELDSDDLFAFVGYRPSKSCRVSRPTCARSTTCRRRQSSRPTRHPATSSTSTSAPIAPTRARTPKTDAQDAGADDQDAGADDQDNQGY